MDIKIKILACVAPFGIAGAVGFSLLSPAWEDFQTKSQNVADKQHESEDLQNKLANRAKIQKEKADLEAAIALLRDAVPKKPDVEILTIDLENMALASGLDVTSIKEPDKEALKKAGLDDESSAATSSSAELSKNKAALANKVKEATAPAAAAAGAAAGALAKAAKGTQPSVSPDGGLSKNIVQVKLIGSYKNLMAFVHKLETYQRVVAISELHASLPKTDKNLGSGAKAAAQLPDEADIGENDDPGSHEQLNISLMLTTYYLP